MDLQAWLTLAGGLFTTLAVGYTAWLNYRAHADTTTRIDGVTTRIDGVTTRINRVEQNLTTRIDAVDEGSKQRDEARRRDLEGIALNVAFLAGRQAERDKREDRRDRQAPRAPGKHRRTP